MKNRLVAEAAAYEAHLATCEFDRKRAGWAADDAEAKARRDELAEAYDIGVERGAAVQPTSGLGRARALAASGVCLCGAAGSGWRPGSHEAGCPAR